MDKQYLNYLRFIFAISDISLLNMCLFVCYYLGEKYNAIHNVVFFNYLLASSIIWLLSSRLFSLYNTHTITKKKCLHRATRRSIAAYLVMFYFFVLLFDYENYSAVFLISFYALTVLGFLLSRITYKTLEDYLTRNINISKSVNVLAIASIGGHWVQLLRLMPVFKANDVTFISTKASLEDTVDGYKYYSVPDANRNNKMNLIKCCLSIARVILFSRPEIVITTGAAPGLFGIFIGRLLGIKTVWIDSIANVEKLSLSGHIALKVADRVYTQWEHLSTPKIVFAGNILEG